MTPPLYIDGKGRLMGAKASSLLPARHGGEQSDSRSLVLEDGGVAIQMRGQTGEVVLRPRLTKDRSLIRLMVWLDETTASQLAVSHFCEGRQRWHSSLLMAPSEAIGYIADLMLAIESRRQQQLAATSELSQQGL